MSPLLTSHQVRKTIGERLSRICFRKDKMVITQLQNPYIPQARLRSVPEASSLAAECLPHR